jgi:XTP/dITP diphosphohydrolase
MGECYEIIAGTANAGKLRELREMLERHGFAVLSPSDVGASLQVDESGDTFEQNATIKAEAYCLATQRVTLADDSGLEVEALGGEPGVRSARYGSADLDDAGRVSVLLMALAGISTQRRNARFVACVAVSAPGRSTRVFRGEVDGRIATAPRGDLGFGYDPIFIPAGSVRTWGEVSRAEKSRCSHRALALERALVYLRALRDGYTEP